MELCIVFFAKLIMSNAPSCISRPAKSEPSFSAKNRSLGLTPPGDIPQNRRGSRYGHLLKQK